MLSEATSKLAGWAYVLVECGIQLSMFKLRTAPQRSPRIKEPSVYTRLTRRTLQVTLQFCFLPSLQKHTDLTSQCLTCEIRAEQKFPIWDLRGYRLYGYYQEKAWSLPGVKPDGNSVLGSYRSWVISFQTPVCTAQLSIKHTFLGRNQPPNGIFFLLFLFSQIMVWTG